MKSLILVHVVAMVVFGLEDEKPQPPPNETAEPLIKSSTTFLHLLKSKNGSPPVIRKKEPEPRSPRTESPDSNIPLNVVELLDGAPTAEAALNAMVAASGAGDQEAALLLVDPAIRPLLLPNIAIERYAIDAEILTRGLFGEREIEVGGMLFWFTQRDLVRIRSLKILDTRVVDDRRVVFTVLTTEKSYHEEKHIHIVRHFLAIHRSGRWYLFRPFGMLASLLQGTLVTADSYEQASLLEVHKLSAGHPNRENAEYEIEYLLPIEVIHEQLAKAAKSPQITAHVRLAEKLRRYYDSVVHRAKRGDYQTRGELRDALQPAEQTVHELVEATRSLVPVTTKLAEQIPKEKDIPKDQ